MPTPEQVDRAIKLLSKQSANCVYFFNKLEDPTWIVPLKDKGLFSEPPELITDKEGHIRPSHIWPQSLCLSRIASKCDDAVHEEILQIMISGGATNNYFIHSDFTEAALSMKVRHAARWGEYEATWLRKGYVIHGSLDQNLGKLASKLSKAGEPAVALRIASELLAVLPDPEEKAKRDEKDEIKRIVQGSLEPTIRCDRYSYEQVLQKNIPDLAQAAPFETLELLCTLLEKAILFSQREGEASKPNDATYVWRPAVEDHEQNKDYKIDCPLITVVRDTAEGICRQSLEKTRDVVLAVEEHEWNIFKRIGMHLLRVSPNAPIDLIEERLVNKALFDDYGCHHEYYHLLSEKFKAISGSGRQQILDWIEQGEVFDGQDDLSPERKVQRKQQWQYRILTAIRSDLTSDWKNQYAAMESKFGPSSMPPDFKSYSSGGVWRGPESPKKADELELMSPAELVAFLKEWKPTGEWMAPTPDGLGVAIGEIVTQIPGRFIENIGQFMDAGIDPTYIRHMISGFCRVVESERPIAYDAVFKFCQWVLDLPNDRPRQDLPAELKDGIDVDRSWRFARSEVVRFVEKSLGEKAQLSFSLRQEVFNIIKQLTDDPVPDVEYGNKSQTDSLSISLNTTRGKALHALMAYAMWVNRNIKAGGKRRPSVGDMPEVKVILDKHLDPNVDPSRATRAVYGQWLPQLVYLGSDWVAENMTRLFPGETDLKPLRDAVWNTYLLYGGRLYSSVTKILKGLYREEVIGLAGKKIEEKTYESPEHRLAEHVVIMYLWKEFELGHDSLIDLLFKVAPQAITAHVMDFIGRDVSRSNEVEESIVDRMKALWDWRIGQASGYDKVPKEELSAFGWWFASGKFEEAWALRNLEATLKRTHINASNLQAIERLSDLYGNHSAAVLRCLRLFVGVNSDQWFFVSSRKQKGVWTVLEQGMASDNVGIRDQAEEIVHLLGSKGYLEFRELLGTASGEREG